MPRARRPVLLGLASALVAACSFPDYVVRAGDPPVDAALVDVSVDAPNEVLAVDADADADGFPADVADAEAADGADGDADADGKGDADASVACPPVRHFTYTMPANATLGCAPSTFFDVVVPATGYALARANLTVVHGPLPRTTYYWNARVAIGAADSEQLSYALGDDVCASTTVAKVNLGYGKLDAVNTHLSLIGQAGAIPCTSGSLEIKAGSSIDVWVESPRAECQKKAIVVASYYKTAGTTVTWDWPTTTDTIVSARIDTEATDKSLLTMAVIEGTPAANPNTVCGSESATLVIQTLLDATILSTQKGAVPASSGMGHLVLDTFNDAPTTVGAHTAKLNAGKNFSSSKVTTGGCCGDATIALVRL